MQVTFHFLNIFCLLYSSQLISESFVKHAAQLLLNSGGGGGGYNHYYDYTSLTKFVKKTLKFQLAKFQHW